MIAYLLRLAITPISLVDRIENSPQSMVDEQVGNEIDRIRFLEAVGDACGLAAFLTADKVSIRATAAMAIGRLGPRAQPAVRELSQLLYDDKVWMAACFALSRIGAAGKAALPALGDILSEPEKCSSAMTVLRAIGPDQSLLAPLIEVVKHGCDDNRGKAALLLGKLGSDAEAAIPVLIGVMLDRSAATFARTCAAQALEQIVAFPGATVEFNNAVARLVSDLDSPDAPLRAITVEILRSLHARRRVVAAALTSSLNDKDWQVRFVAANGLRQSGVKIDLAVNTLTNALSDEDASVQRSAAIWLGEFGAAARSAIPSLKECAKSKTPYVSGAAFLTLQKIDDAIRHANENTRK